MKNVSWNHGKSTGRRRAVVVYSYRHSVPFRIEHSLQKRTPVKEEATHAGNVYRMGMCE